VGRQGLPHLTPQLPQPAQREGVSAEAGCSPLHLGGILGLEREEQMKLGSWWDPRAASGVAAAWQGLVACSGAGGDRVGGFVCWMA